MSNIGVMEVVDRRSLRADAVRLSLRELDTEINRLLDICKEPFHLEVDDAKARAVVYAEVWNMRRKAFK